MIIHEFEGRQVTPTNQMEITFVTHFSNIALVNNVDEYRLAIEGDTVVLTGDDARYFWLKVQEYGTSQYLRYNIYFPAVLQGLEYFVDLSASHRFYKDTNGEIQQVEFKLKSANDFMDFYDRAKGASFALIAKEIGNFNYVDVKYRIVPEDQAEKAVIYILQTTAVTVQAIKGAAQIVKDIQYIVAAATPVVPAGIAIGQIIFASVQLVLDTANFLLEILLVKQSFDRAMEAINPKLRTFKGTKVIELLTKSCQYFGYQFQSNYLTANFADMVILPVPMRDFSDKGLLSWKGYIEQFQNEFTLAYTYGHPSALDYGMTQVWDLIDFLCNKRHLKCVVLNNKVYIEPESYFEDLADLQLKSTMTNQSNQTQSFRFNTEEKWKRTVISYATDQADFYTFDDTDITNAEYSEEIINIETGRKSNLKGLQDRTYPLALGKRNEKLNVLQKELKKMFEKIDEWCNTSLAEKIKDPKGELIISQQYFKVPKVLLVDDNGFLKPNIKQRLDPHLDWDNGINLSSILKNGKEVYEDMEIPMSLIEYRQVMKNNYVYIDGEKAQIISIKYLPYESKSIVSYKKKNIYELGKLQTKLIH